MRILNITTPQVRQENFYKAEIYTQKGRAVGSWTLALLWHCCDRGLCPQGADMGSWALGRVRGAPEDWTWDLGFCVLGRVVELWEARQGR